MDIKTLSNDKRRKRKRSKYYSEYQNDQEYKNRTLIPEEDNIWTDSIEKNNVLR